MYKTILKKNIQDRPDTDYGVLMAFWATCAELIKLKASRRECLQFLQEFGRQFGAFKMVEAKGDMIDAGIL